MKPIILIGAGGHAGVLYDILSTQNREVIAVVSPRDTGVNKILSHLIHIDDADFIRKYSNTDVKLVNGIGQQPYSSLRRKVNEYYTSRGYRFTRVISDSSIVSKYSVLGEGVQILSGVILQAGTVIGDHSIINTGAIVEHDSVIGMYCFMAPGSLVCGSVKVEDDVYIGASATILQNIDVGSFSIVGAGSVLTKNLLPKMVCYPAKSQILSSKCKG